MTSSAPWIMPFPSHMQATDSHHQHRPLHRVGFQKANRSDHYVDGDAAIRRVKRRCKCLDLYKELIPYKEAWSWQKLVEGRRKALIDQDEDHSDVLIILQHPPVYTLGTGSSEKYLNFDIQNAPHEIYRTERGGEVTYHGPGQWLHRNCPLCQLYACSCSVRPSVNIILSTNSDFKQRQRAKIDLREESRVSACKYGLIEETRSSFISKVRHTLELLTVSLPQLVLYPIINLRYHQKDVHWYLRSLEEVVIRVLSSIFSIKASRIEGLTGVWVGNQKVAAIGVRVSRWIASHGLALNVTTDLSPFQHIVPCGIQGRWVGSLSALLDQLSIGKVSDDSTLLDLTHDALLKEFSEVFQLSLEPTSINDLGLSEENDIALLENLQIVPERDSLTGKNLVQM